jgi:hypothetical protein
MSEPEGIRKRVESEEGKEIREKGAFNIPG